MTSPFAHIPVLLPQTIELLQPRAGGRYIDCTLGAGGHAERLLELSGPNGTLLGIDADPAALLAASQRLARFGDRAVLTESYFDRVGAIAAETGFDNADGVLFDLGVSSPQLDTAERGFSFQQDAPLDMRFGPGAEESAADIVKTRSIAELQYIFQEYGEEHHARRVARRIVESRDQGPIETTRHLADIVGRAKPFVPGERIHPATRVFQALRIAVNDELGRLQRALPQALAALHGALEHSHPGYPSADARGTHGDVEKLSGGRLVIISFHSLEDRIVKQFMRDEARGCVCPPELPVCTCNHQPALRILTRKPLEATDDERSENPRARSAKLRAAERL